jgi:hypothetical protein
MFISKSGPNLTLSLQSEQTWTSLDSIAFQLLQQQAKCLADDCHHLSMALPQPQLCQDSRSGMSRTVGESLLAIFLPRDMDCNRIGCRVLDSYED